MRELENAVERAVALACGRRVDVDDLPQEVRSASRGTGGPTTLAEVERRHILATIERNRGNRARPATELGVSPSTLYRKLLAATPRRPRR